MRKKSKNRCWQCDYFDPFGNWWSDAVGIFTYGTCEGTGKLVHNRHHACKYFDEGIVLQAGKMF